MTRPPSVDSYLAAAQRTESAGGATPIATLVRRYLAAVRAHLEQVHRKQGSGRITNAGCSELTDQLVVHLFDLAEQRAYAGAVKRERLAVAAVGGYGREEMSLHSDVDLLFLHDEPLTDGAAAVAEQVQYWFWDAGLSAGCSIRTIPETFDLAREDPSVATAILEIRHLAGAEDLTAALRSGLASDLFSDPEAFVTQQLELLHERHAKFGESLYLLQPNLKEGAGGLRDYHAARWAMRATHPDASGIGSFAELCLLSNAELQELETALDFLWHLRNELHLSAGRHSDQMSFSDQEVIASSLGYAEAQGPELPVERFMREYYRHARVIQAASILVLDQCSSRSRPGRSRPAPQEVEDGFQLVGDHLEIPDAAHLRERPVRLLTAFAVAQAHGVPLSRTAARLIRESLDLVDVAFQANPEAADTLLRILGSEQRVFRTLTAANEVGLLGRYLPEWDHIVCRWQHVMYHTYTVDVHTLFLIEELRRLWGGRYERALPGLTELIRDVPDRVVLYLGCLFHDIAKGLGGNHSFRGVEITRLCLERLGLAPERIERVKFLVEQHISMSHIAQRRDLSDPRVIVEFARAVGDRENLRNLYLLTFADTRASSREAWTQWKGSLLGTLFGRTSEFLETGSDDPTRALDQLEAEVEACQAKARALLRALGVAESRVDSYFENMPRRYFVSHSAQEIARHARLLVSFDRSRTLAIAVRETEGGVSELLVCARDVHALYSMVAGTLTSCGLNILGSSVYTTRDGLALEVYRITTPRGGDAERRLAWREFEAALTRVLTGELDLATAIRSRSRPLGQALPPVTGPVRVSITNDESDFYTIVDVTTDDRLGLLYDLTRTIAEHDLEIYLSKATTILDQVADTFYLKDAQRKKLTDAGRIRQLQDELEGIAQKSDV